MREIFRRRCVRHKRYISKRMAELQMEICQEAIQTGIVDKHKREQLFKYRDKFNKIKNGSK
jgi:hypothetical protein